jgi:ribosome-associated protein
VPARRPVDVPIREESIRLGQFLKLADLAETGSDAKELIAAGEVLVNGEPETRRGRQLRVGDVVEFDGRPARVARRPGPAAVLVREGAGARHAGAAGSTASATATTSASMRSAGCSQRRAANSAACGQTTWKDPHGSSG